MNILISGSTGLTGRRLRAALEERGHTVTAAGRADFAGDPALLKEKVEQTAAVIHLAGAPIVARWSKAYKQEILDSRVFTTRKLVEAVNLAERKPELFISASAVGIYSDEGVNTEEHASYAEGFLADVCRQWEGEAAQLNPVTGLAVFRLGVVLAKEGGALPKMLTPFRLGLGGPIAGGRQGFSWIHIDDLVGAFMFVLDRRLTGTFNLTAPGVTDNQGYTSALGRVLRRPVFIPVPALALRLLFGEGASALTTGQKAVPERLLKVGFTFRFPEVEGALRDLLG
ncbi:MAG: TIGR01777 family oxidoreductase [Lentimicrobium sp.]